ncbi:hypothetical protein [Amycolatopsis suaedae]|uniref:Uncharacterized protein n=1 Tax=Amycolatopsis suaedae TaxID=2510978 RepID=A0A4Q7IZC0_9PSEU|nr:hypothetical protein [Amycolatopsis suaedae]RZQ59817.1 hypothetical protein EWH70_32395 [Amycolatopsis suaedae]
MSVDYDDILARSIDEPAFSNGTEGDAWTAKWCCRCLRDAPFRNMGRGSGCPILLVTMMGRRPAELLDGPRDEQGRYSMADQYTCVEFRRPGGGGDGEPHPRPEPPGMDGLFPRPDRARRMYVQPDAVPTEVSVDA